MHNTVKDSVRNQWKLILPLLGIDSKFLVGHHGPCPACGGKDRFRFDDKSGNGTFFCNQCGAGDGFTLLMKVKGWSFYEAKKAVSGALGGHHTSVTRNDVQRIVSKPEIAPNWNAYRDILALWESGYQVTASDPAGIYLRNSRCIPLEFFPSALRYAHVGWMNGKPSEIGRKRDILLAAITDRNSDLVEVQAYLPRPDGKADKFYLKTWLPGSMNGCSLKLYEPADTLAIGEGLETCLAWYCQHKIPVWSATSAGLMEAVVIPDSVTSVIILADNDSVKTNQGLKSAKKLAERMLADGRNVQIRIPNTVKDYADLYADKVRA